MAWTLTTTWRILTVLEMSPIKFKNKTALKIYLELKHSIPPSQILVSKTSLFKEDLVLLD